MPKIKIKYQAKNFTLLTSSRGKLAFILNTTCVQTLLTILICHKQTFTIYPGDPMTFRFSKRLLIGRPVGFKKIAVLKKKKKV